MLKKVLLTSLLIFIFFLTTGKSIPPRNSWLHLKILKNVFIKALAKLSFSNSIIAYSEQLG